MSEDRKPFDEASLEEMMSGWSDNLDKEKREPTHTEADQPKVQLSPGRLTSQRNVSDYDDEIAYQAYCLAVKRYSLAVLFSFALGLTFPVFPEPFGVVLSVIAFAVAAAFIVVLVIKVVQRVMVVEQQRSAVASQEALAKAKEAQELLALLRNEIENEDAAASLIKIAEQHSSLSQFIYQESLTIVRLTKGHPKSKWLALQAGRANARVARKGPVTNYDENAIANDINAQIHDA